MKPRARIASAAVLLIAAIPAGRAADAALEDLVSRLDRVRIPARSCAATIEISRPDRPGEPTQVFRSFTRVDGSGAGRRTSALLVCAAPAKDAGKVLLFTPDACWFYDPKAKNPARLSPGQLWSQPASADSPNWHLATDFSAAPAGREEIVCGDGARRACAVIDFAPRLASLAAPALMRYWVGDDGRYWRAEHYTAGRRLAKTIEGVTYGGGAGATHVAGMTIRSGPEAAGVRVIRMVAKESPAAWFEPAALSSIGQEVGVE